MKPIIKWAGGKQRLVATIRSQMPTTFGRYYEPFAGGLALYLSGAAGLHPATLSDNNPELVNFYLTLRNRPEALLVVLENYYPVTAEAYQEVRANVPELSLERAARFLYLNKLCYNGLYRVNRQGLFNVPWGKRDLGYRWFVRPTLEEASRFLHEASICLGSYEDVLKTGSPSDFAYLDPPYDGAFDAYTSDKFDQFALRDQFYLADRKGLKLLMSQSDTLWIRQQYAGYRLIEVETRQSIKPGTKRKELLIANYEAGQ